MGSVHSFCSTWQPWILTLVCDFVEAAWWVVAGFLICSYKMTTLSPTRSIRVGIYNNIYIIIYIYLDSLLISTLCIGWGFVKSIDSDMTCQFQFTEPCSAPNVKSHCKSGSWLGIPAQAQALQPPAAVGAWQCVECVLHDACFPPVHLSQISLRAPGSANDKMHLPNLLSTFVNFRWLNDTSTKAFKTGYAGDNLKE